MSAHLQRQDAWRLPQSIALPANENFPLKSDWMTPAEALQAILRMKARLAKENAEASKLFISTQRRKVWEEILACEKCLRWHYFRMDSIKH